MEVIQINKCAICGANLPIYKKCALKKKYCSNECRNIGIRRIQEQNKITNAYRWQKPKAEVITRTNDPEALDRHANEAAAQGVSYGIIQAKNQAKEVKIEFPSFVKKTRGNK